MAGSNVVAKLYRGVMEDVIKNVRESFLNEGVDEQVLQELKQIWESKLVQTRAIDMMPTEGQRPVQATFVYPHIPPQPQIVQRTEAHKAVNIAPAVRVPEAVTPQQAASGQTAIMYPSAHAHAIGQMTPAASAATMAIPGSMTQIQQAATSHGKMHFTTVQIYQFLRKSLVASGVHVIQVDGANDSDSDEEDDEDDDDEDDEGKDKSKDELEEDPYEDEDPLNSNDDVSDDDPGDLFDTDNVVVCQFDKIARSRNKWKFHLKDGIMNLRGKDYVFQKATGEAEW
ncbi:PREDICTED: transcription initiation factor IIA subunit 1-like [Acropora digitifera]|uniref:transcription initiation factor IIA subunit 1-like n=1 Tax=Acropora digitifera TaxID=70779 RepID=UPI00077ACED0|nr:PREDICTED: transcription initiation factor IIA subunit 1-like [Acropora digitifera]